MTDKVAVFCPGCFFRKIGAQAAAKSTERRRIDGGLRRNPIAPNGTLRDFDTRMGIRKSLIPSGCTFGTIHVRNLRLEPLSGTLHRPHLAPPLFRRV